MKKQTYKSPQLRVVEMNVEGLIATSDRIPMDPNPGTPATNKYEGAWSCSQWEKDAE